MYKCAQSETHDTNLKPQTKNQSNTKQHHHTKNPSPRCQNQRENGPSIFHQRGVTRKIINETSPKPLLKSAQTWPLHQEIIGSARELIPPPTRNWSSGDYGAFQ